MALDGIYLHHLQKELSEALLQARVDKIHQPNRDELVMAFRSRAGVQKLLLSARANSARVHLMAGSLENPKQPPMLCMLLRKKLGGAKLTAVNQPGLERVLGFTFDAVNELGDHVSLTLYVEIMGKYSNIVLVDENGRVVDALKRVDAETSSQRLVLPGLFYELPPPQDKLNLLTATVQEVTARVQGLEKDMALSKALLNVVQGVSPVVCRELEHQVGRGQEVAIRAMDEEQMFRLGFFCQRLKELALAQGGTPHAVLALDGKPIDFSFFDIHQYGPTVAVVRKETGFSALLDHFYHERDTRERMRVKEQDLLRLLANASERIARKINHQRGELAASTDRDKFRIAGDLLSANVHLVVRGAESVTVQNFYEEDLPDMEIPLNPALTAGQNAQQYYKRYRKAKTAQEMLTGQIAVGERELTYLDSVLEALTRAETERDIGEIRTELMETGYIRSQRKKKERVPSLGEPLRFEVAGGFEVLVGKNNRQNDQLTLRTAAKQDLWFHTKNIPGSHTILRTAGRTPSEAALQEAATLAARHSRGRDSSNVPVDYTLVKHVSKPSGAKPGMVVYVNNKTLYVTPG